jgi:hypothetical protein
LCDQLSSRGVNNAAKFGFQRWLLDWFDFDTGGSFDRLFDRLLGLNFRHRGGNFQQLQQREIDID